MRKKKGKNQLVLSLAKQVKPHYLVFRIIKNPRYCAFDAQLLFLILWILQRIANTKVGFFIRAVLDPFIRDDK
jgi:hypothetical protein